MLQSYLRRSLTSLNFTFKYLLKQLPFLWRDNGGGASGSLDLYSCTRTWTGGLDEQNSQLRNLIKGTIKIPLSMVNRVVYRKLPLASLSALCLDPKLLASLAG